MLVNESSLDLVFKGFKTVYQDNFDNAPSHFEKIAMTVPSSAREGTYGFLGMFPNLREWLGPRVVSNLSASTFSILNRKFESTLAVERDHISDDRLGIFKPMFAQMGVAAKQHPDRLIFELLAAGFSTNCYDGQFYFDTDHPVLDAAGVPVNVSNFGGGAAAPWFLLDTSRAVRPLIWQEREPYAFQTLDRDSDPNVFFEDRYIYGVRARVNAGFGFWQLAYGSKQTLNATNYAAARAALMNFKGDGGASLGIVPTTLVVGPTLEEAALNIVNTEYATGGASNPWKGTASLIITPYL